MPLDSRIAVPVGRILKVTLSVLEFGQSFHRFEHFGQSRAFPSRKHETTGMVASRGIGDAIDNPFIGVSKSRRKRGDKFPCIEATTANRVYP
jgi:hypothetical protein